MKGKIKKWFSEQYYSTMLTSAIKEYYKPEKIGSLEVLRIAYNCKVITEEVLKNGGFIFDRKLKKFIRIDDFYDMPWKYAYGSTFDTERYFLYEKIKSFEVVK